MHRLATVMKNRLDEGDVAGAMEQFNLFSASMSDQDVCEAMRILSGMMYGGSQ